MAIAQLVQTTTASAASTSRSANAAPSAIVHDQVSRYDTEMPRAWVVQFPLADTTDTVWSVCSATLRMRGTSARIASASSAVRVTAAWLPVRPPRTLREPAEMYTRSLPSAAS